MADRRDQDRPTQQDPREQEHLDEQAALHNDPFQLAPYQMGNLDAAADPNVAAGEATGTARRAEEAAGQPGDPETAEDAERAFQESRGNRDERSQDARH